MDVQVENRPEENRPAEKPAGDLFGLGALFQSKPPETSPQSSQPSSTGSGEPLSPEAERLLAGVPGVIGDGRDPASLGETQTGAVGSSTGEGALLGSLICDAEMVQEALVLVMGQIADWRKRDVYRLDEARAGLLARPYSEVINALWAQFAPAVFTEFCNSIPGLAKAVLMSAVIFTPMVKADMEQTRKEKQAARRGADPSSTRGARTPVPSSAPGGAVVWAEGVR